VFNNRGFTATPGMPTAWLHIDFTSIDEYLQRLSGGTRKDMRRKLKANRHIRVEMRADFIEWLPRVMELYTGTRDRSDWQFEALTAEYFTGVLQHMPGRSLCFFYFEGENLLAANILVRNGEVLIDKFFCMDGIEGRKHNLYYLSWFNNLRYCLEQGIARYQSGQAYYENKLRLGSSLTPNTMYFRHGNPAVQWVLKTLAPLFALGETADKAP
jgi:predicted N-acyltransferase